MKRKDNSYTLSLFDSSAQEDGKATQRTISDFPDTDYKTYIFYILATRCLPSLCDGFKVGARKILYSAFTGSLRNGETKKVTNLSGDTMNYSLYMHGDNSLNNTIVTLSQGFKFNLTPLYIDGQSGDLRSPKASASPRYLYVRLSKYAKLWQVDKELLEYNNEEGQKVEPKFYWPIIPMVLVNSQEGIGVGYKFSCMSYNPIDVIDGCISVLGNKDSERQPDMTIHPYIRGIRKDSWKREGNRWVNYGKYSLDLHHDCVKITELPYDATFTSFEGLLNKLIEKGTIKDWKNFSEGEAIDYRIQFPKKRLAVEISGKTGEGKIVSLFKLRKQVPDDLLWVLDENGKIKHFETPDDLIEYFAKWRLRKYDLRKSQMVKVLEKELEDNSQLIRFIELVCSGKLVLRNRPKKEISVDMKGLKLPLELISTPMSRVTKEEHEALLKENEAIRKRLEYIKQTTTEQMYTDDLKELRKQLLPDFK